MEINKFMTHVLNELEDLKATTASKKSYLIQNLEFELSIVVEKKAGAGGGLPIVAIGGAYANKNIQKVKISLRPKLRASMDKDLTEKQSNQSKQLGKN